MIKAKLIALCVCPALAAPPAILAVSPPARHAVAHVLHHAARHLDHRPPVVVAATPLPCPPALALATEELPTHRLIVAPVDAVPSAPPLDQTSL